MARKSRIKSSTGIYHALIRANAYVRLFRDQEDREFYTRILKDLEEKGSCDICAFSLYETHVHLLVKEKADTISTVIKRISSTYSYYYNVKYEHYGPIYLDRFKSEPVETDAFFEDVKAFIEGKPVKGGNTILDYNQRPKRMTDTMLLEYLQLSFSFTDLPEFRTRPMESQLKTIKAARAIGGSVRQLFRLTGVPYNVIAATK